MKNSEVLQTAYTILSRRAYSVRELRLKLLEKNYGKDQIDEVVFYLTERGYLNDTALCGMLVRKYMNCGKYGKKAVMHKIMQRGVSGEIIQETIAQNDFNELSQAICLIEKILAKSSKKFDKVKIGRFLINRGFSYNTIQQAFEQFENVDINN